MNRTLNHMHIVDVKNDLLPDIIKTINTPMIVELWAPWCEPCRQINPILLDIAEELAGKVKVLKVNIEENEKTAKAQSINSIPTLLLLDAKGQQIGDPIIGFSKSLQETIYTRLDPYIN